MSEPVWNGKYPCQNYGNRDKDYSFCSKCPEKIVEACSILTLEKWIKTPIDIITARGNKVTVGAKTTGKRY